MRSGLAGARTSIAVEQPIVNRPVRGSTPLGRVARQVGGVAERAGLGSQWGACCEDGTPPRVQIPHLPFLLTFSKIVCLRVDREN